MSSEPGRPGLQMFYLPQSVLNGGGPETYSKLGGREGFLEEVPLKLTSAVWGVAGSIRGVCKSPCVFTHSTHGTSAHLFLQTFSFLCLLQTLQDRGDTFCPCSPKAERVLWMNNLIPRVRSLSVASFILASLPTGSFLGEEFHMC